MSAEEFWHRSDALRRETQDDADNRFALLRSAPVEELQRVWSHYRFFTKRYITDLAMLVSRIPAGRMRSVLGVILADELGQGDFERDHLRLYDRFLASCEVSPSALEEEPSPTTTVLDDLSERVRRETVAYAIGLRGMGGECMCTLYLAAMERQFAANPWVASHRAAIDWTFWDLHLGEADDIHAQMLREGVSALIERSPRDAEDLAAGFLYANESWTRFWNVVLPPVATRRVA